jgi:hypothetical protein
VRLGVMLGYFGAGTTAAEQLALAQEAEQLIGGDGSAPNQRLGLPPDAGRDELRAVALERLTTWRRRAESPMSSRAMANAARVVVRSCEGIRAGLR